MTESGIAVLGIGNLIQQDEGVGVHIIERLQKQYEFTPDVALIDGGTMGTDLLPYLEAHDRIVIVDAVNFDEPPGFIGTIENEDILRRLNTKLSIHHLGLTDVLSTARLLEIEPSEIFLIGVQPQIIEMGTELTPLIAGKVDQMIGAVFDKLGEWGVEVRKKN